MAQYRFRPELDISAFELAQIVARIAVPTGATLWNAMLPEPPADMPESVRRHLKLIPDELRGVRLLDYLHQP